MSQMKYAKSCEQVWNALLNVRRFEGGIYKPVVDKPKLTIEQRVDNLSR